MKSNVCVCVCVPLVPSFFDKLFITMEKIDIQDIYKKCLFIVKNKIKSTEINL